MNKDPGKDKYAAWLRKLVDVSLPLDLKVKLLSLQPLTKEEARKFMSVIQLAAEAKGLSDHQAIIRKLDELKGSEGTLNTKASAATSLQNLILWYASGNDPRYKPKNGRSVTAIKELMVREGLAMLAKNASLSERSAADILVRKYADVPGAYDDVETLRKQLNRKNPYRK